MSVKPDNAADRRLIDEAVAAGRVKRCITGAISDWDSLPFRTRREKMLFKNRKPKVASK